MNGPEWPTPLRAASMLAAIAAALSLLLWPWWLGRELSRLDHSLLPFFMLGISGGFVIGFGFRPRHRLPRFCFHPVTAWLLLLGLPVIFLLE